jgi:hypothetical protein
MALLFGIAGAIVLIFVARWSGRDKHVESSSKPDDQPGQKL